MSVPLITVRADMSCTLPSYPPYTLTRSPLSPDIVNTGSKLRGSLIQSYVIARGLLRAVQTWASINHSREFGCPDHHHSSVDAVAIGWVPYREQMQLYWAEPVSANL